MISIHSLRAEGDGKAIIEFIMIINFNPLPPCGGRLDVPAVPYEIFVEFQSTPSVRRETYDRCMNVMSIEFQSTPSVRRETKLCSSNSKCSGFQSTPSVRRETSECSGYEEDDEYFNPLPPCGGRRAFFVKEIHK